MTREESVDTAQCDYPLPDIAHDEDFRSVIKKLSMCAISHFPPFRAPSGRELARTLPRSIKLCRSLTHRSRLCPVLQIFPRRD